MGEKQFRKQENTTLLSGVVAYKFQFQNIVLEKNSWKEKSYQ